MKPRMITVDVIFFDQANPVSLGCSVQATVNRKSVSLAWVDPDKNKCLHLLLDNGREIVCVAYTDTLKMFGLYHHPA